MDIGIHWGVFKHLRNDVGANAAILMTAIILDVVVLGAFLWFKVQSDALVIWASLIGLAVIFIGEKYFLKIHRNEDENE
jgi:hypothetical protein